MYSIKDYYLNSINKLQEIYDYEEARSIVNIWFMDAFHVEKQDLNSELKFEVVEKYNSQLVRVLNFEPIQYIIGFTYFLNLKFNVNNSVLIPRPETEELVLKAKEICTKFNFNEVVEIGTGSGCISIGLSSKLPKLSITATDISTYALEIAKINCKEILNNSKINFLQHDILKDDWNFSIPELVISNPPYILFEESKIMEKNVLNFEPHSALFVTNNDSLQFYKVILDKFLAIGVCHFLFEINQNEKHELSNLFMKLNMKFDFFKDINNNFRMVFVYS